MTKKMAENPLPSEQDLTVAMHTMTTKNFQSLSPQPAPSATGVGTDSQAPVADSATKTAQGRSSQK